MQSQSGTPEDRSAALSQWSEDTSGNTEELADMLGITPAEHAEDPLTLLAPLQEYVSQLPLDDFEQSDWVALHTDLASFVADVLARHDASW